MLKTTEELIDYCRERDYSLADYVLAMEVIETNRNEAEILKELYKLLAVMLESGENTLETGSNINHHLINNFAKKTWDYANSDRPKVTGREILRPMARAFSGLETNAAMGKVVAAPTAGSAGILPAALLTAKEELNCSDEKLVEGILTAVGIGQFIGGYATFAGAEGGCQSECGAAASMAAGALVSIYNGTIEEIFTGASIALINVLGLVCDPIGGLVQFPCTFRNASGIVNAMISADLALAGTTSIVPFEEICQALKDVGDSMPSDLRETGIGGLAGTRTGQRIMKDLFD